MPLGTVDEVREAGLDPAKTTCCARGVKDQVQACPMWGGCRFDQPSKAGVFKGTGGPHYVGLEIYTGETLPSGEPAVNRTSMLCHAYVRTMQERADAGETARQRGKPGEVIRLCAKEGDKLVTRMLFPFNAAGKVINQTPKRFKELEAQGIEVDRTDKREAAYWEPILLETTVPKFPRLAERKAVGFAQGILESFNEQDERRKEVEAQLLESAMPSKPTTRRPRAEPVAVAEPEKPQSPWKGAKAE